MARESTFFVGESDLVVLGLAATLPARYEMRRKRGQVPLQGYPHDDAEANSLLTAGVRLGNQWHLDDVPRIRMEVHVDGEVLQRLVEVQRSVHRRLTEMDEGDEGPPAEIPAE